MAWSSPSNIALIKYWGKKPTQIPCNASISFTLTEAKTTTQLHFAPRKDQNEWINFLFEGKESPSFSSRIYKTFESWDRFLPFLHQFSFRIESENSFPHSSGIASSASSMSALALCLCEMEIQLIGGIRDENFYRKASFLSRLGSGSACRSIYQQVAAWGRSDAIAHSHDEYAIPIEGIDPVFHNFCDTIVIVNGTQKAVSSTKGHELMNSNPFAPIRYQLAESNMEKIMAALRSGDLDTFGQIVEDEALQLHALMMCSSPSYILMHPNTLQCINEIRTFRADTKIPIYFTLDAGPNVHILYPQDKQTQCVKFIHEMIMPLSEDNYAIYDRVGMGPQNLKG